MNRIVLIGNGFDLAHGLPTRYEDFINWYWDQRVLGFCTIFTNTSRDILCEFKIEDSLTWQGFYNQIVSPFHEMKGKEIIDNIINNRYNVKIGVSYSPFFQNIIKSIKTKGWVDIENEYYNLLIGCTIGKERIIALNDLNKQFSYLTSQLLYYLNSISTTKDIKRIDSIWYDIYSPINDDDVSIEGQHVVDECVEGWMLRNVRSYREKIKRYELDESTYLNEIKSYKENPNREWTFYKYPQLFMLPEQIMLLSFNYTYLADLYRRDGVCEANNIHGTLFPPDDIIFGYGDELDEKYKQLQELNNNECLRNIKSIKYLESNRYRYVLRFLESAPFQVLIMGHSCGNSDRTLLNTIFEHKNCISIKPYYHRKNDGTDNYLDIVQNISRSFTDMKLMRDRVVNKMYCNPLPQANQQ